MYVVLWYTGRNPCIILFIQTLHIKKVVLEFDKEKDAAVLMSTLEKRRLFYLRGGLAV